MKVSAIVFDRGDLSEVDSRLVCASASSVLAAGHKHSRATPEEAIAVTIANGPDYCQFLEAGTVVLPDFYEAAISAMAYSKMDFAYCWCVRLSKERGVLKTPTPNNLVMGQLLVRSWVVMELASRNKMPLALLNCVLNEYRGTEVPHVMAMEI